MENTFMQQKKLWMALALVVVLALIYVVVTREKEAITPLSADGTISWQLISSANKEATETLIADLTGRLSEEKDIATKYEIAVGLSNLYRDLGDGENALVYLNKAATIIPERGLAYMNAGDLFSRLFATTSARTYFERGVAYEPQFEQNHILYISYLRTSKAPAADIEKAFTEGLSRTGRSDNLLKEYATWLSEEKHFADAIKVWEEELTRNPPNASAIQHEIERLKNKQNAG